MAQEFQGGLKADPSLWIRIKAGATLFGTISTLRKFNQLWLIYANFLLKAFYFNFYNIPVVFGIGTGTSLNVVS